MSQRSPTSSRSPTSILRDGVASRSVADRPAMGQQTDSGYPRQPSSRVPSMCSPLAPCLVMEGARGGCSGASAGDPVVSGPDPIAGAADGVEYDRSVHLGLPCGALGAVDLGDDLQEHPVAHRARRHGSFAPGVVARHRDPQHPAGDLHRVAVAYDGGDDLEAPFGWICSRNNSLARLVTANSHSSSRIRRRAAANAADSPVATPGRSPRSTRSCLRQL